MFRRCQLARFFRRTPLLWADEKEQVFERYTEIENSNARRISGLKAAGLFNDEWIATEKVHGANFGIYSINHGKTIRYAKRSGIMPPNEHFFGYHILIPDLTLYAQKCRELLTTQLQVSASSIIVNGELFGGKYDHPNVPKKRQSVLVGGRARSITAVQSDPFPQYCPDLHFYAFDIKYKLNEEDTDYVTLTYDEATAIFEAIPGLLYAKAIIRGPLSKVAAFDVETFTTTIPPLVGMGDYPLKGNWAEGLVVKHHKRGKPGFDPAVLTILKFKSTAFQEISNDRLQGPRVDEMEEVRRESIQVSGVQLPDIESVIRDPEVRAATQHLLNHVCDNRLKSVLSKIGTDPFETQTMTPNELATLLAKDALKDFLKEAEPKIVNSPLLLRREITRYVLFESRKYIARKWKQIVAQQTEASG
ncbi:putative mitochondrial mitochondrial RNA ligase 2 [Leptomonas pyrrhocoris]|uniref:RNA ligase (ATP) n=1 Tax=Leptomonas pyrrhocoris TaxID=157538 RepID=A0A0N0VDB6_LEPPY|nr:putative mitochondrial mitochondrial RNA ligase 2 [Leptomonas pyrrhocoris]KPA75194.1 putative mitochondrial mitochondrial RNA ligase 2 [Leptomonas pyrrhocoris]|eukprot:XP_015653633.1 putative mitochondrial mitochondrial RNA ligase 2 [Leptomonas pyrrhocoris]